MKKILACLLLLACVGCSKNETVAPENTTTGDVANFEKVWTESSINSKVIMVQLGDSLDSLSKERLQTVEEYTALAGKCEVEDAVKETSISNAVAWTDNMINQYTQALQNATFTATEQVAVSNNNLVLMLEVSDPELIIDDNAQQIFFYNDLTVKYNVGKEQLYYTVDDATFNTITKIYENEMLNNLNDETLTPCWN